MFNTFEGPMRDAHPCKSCHKKDQRPACRKGCEKDEAWHNELERVKANKLSYERRVSVRYNKRCEFGEK